jgi:16S rRNA (adenine1518-N6/adenine1519-N6)-dimethyltransferase
MMDQRVNATIRRAVLSLGQGVDVLEIGAGTGSLTEHLLSIAPMVHAVERDRDLVPILRTNFEQELNHGKLIIHEADGARFDLSTIFSPTHQGIMVGNLPYHLTSSIILLALRNHQLLKGAIFLVQKEVADRILAVTGGKEYGFLPVLLNLAFTMERVSNVNRNAFWPVPRVDSAIIKLSSSDRGISQVEDLDGLLLFVRGTFQKRRKKLSNILQGTFDKAELVSLNISPDLRPQDLSPQQFLELFLKATTHL